MECIDFPGSTQEYHTFEKNNEDIALNVLLIAQESRNVRQEYISHYNFTRNKQVVILKIKDGEKWHFLALKSIKQDDNTHKPTLAFSKLMQNISSKSHENYYCYGCFHTFRTQSKLEEHHNLCKNKDNCPIRVPKEGKNTLSHKFGTKCLKINDVIYLDLESILEKYNTTQNNEDLPRIIKKDLHSVCGYSMIHVSNHNKNVTILLTMEKIVFITYVKN